MDRREALKRVAFLLGGTLSAPAISGVLSGCRVSSDGETWTPQTLTAQQNDLVATIAEHIIPETDTPGARAARVHEFIDRMLTEWYPAEDRERFLAGLAEVDERSQQMNGGALLESSAEEQVAVLSALDEEAFADEAGSSGEQPFFRTMKELTLLGYYTSEVGATEELQWLAVPGRYEGCIPLEEAGTGRTWAA